MKQFHINRLTKLVDFLKVLPNDKFDMSWYVNGNNAGCFTIGCACGWATTIPSFRKAGFKLGDGFTSYMVTFKDRAGRSAVIRFFGLENPADFENLFTISAYINPTKNNTIRRLKAFINKNQKKLDGVKK